MDRIHSQKTRPTRGMRLAALPDAYLRRPCPGHRQATAPVRCRLAKPVQMTVREPRQTLEPDIAEHRVLALHHAPSDRAAQTAQGLVHLGQQTDVRLRVAPGKRTPRTPAPVLDPPRIPVLRDQPRDLRPTEPRHLDHKAPHQTLVGPRQPNVARTHQNPPHETVRIGALHEPEVDRRAAGHEVADLVEGPQPFDIESQDHPPMIPNPVSGSSLEGLTTLLQAHLSWDKASL